MTFPSPLEDKEIKGSEVDNKPKTPVPSAEAACSDLRSATSKANSKCGLQIANSQPSSAPTIHTLKAQVSASSNRPTAGDWSCFLTRLS